MRWSENKCMKISTSWRSITFLLDNFLENRFLEAYSKLLIRIGREYYSVSIDVLFLLSKKPIMLRNWWISSFFHLICIFSTAWVANNRRWYNALKKNSSTFVFFRFFFLNFKLTWTQYLNTIHRSEVVR